MGTAINVLLIDNTSAQTLKIKEMLISGAFRFNAAESLESYKQNTAGFPDIILLDSLTGNKCGFTNIKAAFPKTPIIVLTNPAQKETGAQPDFSEADELLHHNDLTPRLLELSIKYIIDNNRNARALDESEARFRSFYENSSIGLYRTTPSGEIIYANDALIKMLGFNSLEELAENNLEEQEFHPEYDRAKFREMLEREGSIKGLEFQWRKKDRSPFYARESTKLIYGDNGEILYYDGTVEDVTDRRKAELALEESEVRYRRFFNEGLTGNYLSTIDGKLLMCNDVFALILKYNKEDILKVRTDEFYPAKLDRENFMRKLQEEKKIVNQEMVLKAADGSLITVVENVIGIFDEKGALKEITGYMFDITDRKRAEKELTESEERYRKLFDTNPHPMWVYNIDTLEFLAVNEAAINHYGYSEKEFLGMKITDIRPHEDIPRLLSSINYYPGIDHAGLWRHLKKNGEIIDVEIISHMLNFDDKNADLVLSLDVTEKLKVQEEILKLSRAVEQSPVTIVITDIDGNIEYVNPKFVQTTGYSLSEAKGQNPRILKSGFTPTSEYEKLWNTIRSGHEWKGEFYNRKKNGEYYWESASISPIRNGGHEIKYFVGVKEDITEQKKLLKELVEAKEKAEEMNRLKSNFLSNMSHELRTPLNGILGFTEIMLSELIEPEHIKMANIVNQSGKRLLETLNHILDLSRIEANKQEVNTTNINCSKLLHRIHQLFSGSIDQQKIKFTAVDKTADECFNSDERIIETVLNNLVNNAVKFTEQGYIDLFAETVTKNNKLYIQFTIKDSGIGILPENLDLIFGEFRQVSEGYNRRFEGTGLGLTICRKYVELLGGVMNVSSEYGKGSVFSFSIPACEFNINNGVTLSDEEIKNSENDHIPEILLIDDDENSRLIVPAFLRKHYKTDTAECALTALKKISSKQYKLILLDIGLNGKMDGIQVLQELRKNRNYADVPVIAFTAYALKGQREKFLACGFNDYISKPFSKDSLIEKLAANCKAG